MRHTCGNWCVRCMTCAAHIRGTRATLCCVCHMQRLQRMFSAACAHGQASDPSDPDVLEQPSLEQTVMRLSVMPVMFVGADPVERGDMIAAYAAHRVCKHDTRSNETCTSSCSALRRIPFFFVAAEPD